MKKITILTILITCYLNLFSQNCNQTFSGDGTFYGYSGGGNCSFATPTSPIYTGAMNESQYDGSVTCGACVEVTGAKGALVISIEDQCPECKYGDIDLSEEAFPLIDDKINGRVPITWKFVGCPVKGAVKFYFKEGSTQWWTAVQVRNHKYPISKLEYKANNQWVNMERKMYNYFLVESGMGTGPFSFRITDMYGDIIEENDIPLIVTKEIDGQNQFPDCKGSTGISETGIPLIKELGIMPNPVTDMAKIIIPKNQVGNATLKIIDNAGRTIKILMVKEETCNINMSGFEKGMYTLVVNGNGIATRKAFVKK